MLTGDENVNNKIFFYINERKVNNKKDLFSFLKPTKRRKGKRKGNSNNCGPKHKSKPKKE